MIQQVIRSVSQFSETPLPLVVAVLLFIPYILYQFYLKVYETDEIHDYLQRRLTRLAAFSVIYVIVLVVHSPSTANGFLVIVGFAYTYHGAMKPFYRNYGFLTVFISGLILFLPDPMLLVVDYLQGTLINLAVIIQSRPLTSTVVALSYLAWKQSANETRFEREEALRARLQGNAKTVAARLNPEETLTVAVKDIRVRERQGLVYQIWKYFPRFVGGGFSGASEIVAQYDASHPITIDGAWAELDGSDAFTYLTDFTLSESRVTLAFNTAHLPALEDRINNVQETLFQSSRDEHGGSIAGGQLKQARVRYYIPNDFIHRLSYLQEHVTVIRRLAPIDRIVVWRVPPEVTGIRRRPKLVVEKADGSEDKFESLSTWDELKSAITSTHNPVYDGITRLRRVYEDITVDQVIEEEYNERGDGYTAIVFEITPNHTDTLSGGVQEGIQINDDSTEIAVRAPITHDEITITADDDFEQRTVDEDETYQVRVPTSGFVPAAFDSLNNEPLEAAGIDRDEPIGKYLNDRLAAELVTSDDYALYSYYRLDDERYCSVRWPPVGDPRIWRVGTCSESAPLPRRGYTVWERINTDHQS